MQPLPLDASAEGPDRGQVEAATRPRQKRLGEMLVDAGLLTAEQVRRIDAANCPHLEVSAAVTTRTSANGQILRCDGRSRASRSHLPIPSRSAQGERQTAVGRGLYPDGTVSSFVLRYLRETMA